MGRKPPSGAETSSLSVKFLWKENAKELNRIFSVGSMSKGLRVLLSFFSMICGWGAGFACYAGYMVFLSKWGRVTDANALLFYTGIFIFIAWLLFFVPLVVFSPEKNPLFFKKVAPFFGAVYGVAVFLLLVGWWTGFWKFFFYWGYASVVGGTAGLVYSYCLVQFTRRET